MARGVRRGHHRHQVRRSRHDDPIVASSRSRQTSSSCVALGCDPSSSTAAGHRSSAMLDRLDVAAEFVDGLRVTTPEAMDVVRMVLTGQVQRDIVGLINQHGPLAVGMSGEDAHLFTADARPGAMGESSRSRAW